VHVYSPCARGVWQQQQAGCWQVPQPPLGQVGAVLRHLGPLLPGHAPAGAACRHAVPQCSAHPALGDLLLGPLYLFAMCVGVYALVTLQCACVCRHCVRVPSWPCHACVCDQSGWVCGDAVCGCSICCCSTCFHQVGWQAAASGDPDMCSERPPASTAFFRVC
jgi:hypothetical protein